MTVIRVPAYTPKALSNLAGRNTAGTRRKFRHGTLEGLNRMEYRTLPGFKL